ncbi:hypothetical protein HY627_02420 [Candidatus Uhrbacteria bacterium]|nr:hypothetical protein [Candidatus Uhrbacteria bacterium]
MSKTLLARGTKAINITVVTATMLWSSGVASVLPVAAETVTLKDGDLIKSTTAADVYWYSGGKRSPFPNLATFNSWGLSFKNVVKMAQTDLNKIDLSGSNVTYRPCTRLIKIMTDPKTYAVSPSGTLHWIQTEDAAKAYFGDTWNKKIDDVADVFFTNYTKGDNLADASKAIPGCFLRDAGSGDTFYINEDGSKSKVDAAGLAANNVNTGYVLTASGTQLSGAAASTTKPTISAADTSLMMYAPKGTGTGTTPTSPTASTGTGLTVSLASDTPATTSILVGQAGNVGAQALVNMLKLKLTASNDGDIKVNTLKLKRIGVSSDSDVSNAYLYANGVRLAEMSTLTGGVLSFSGAPIVTVAKGSSVDLWLKMDLSTGSTSGKTIGFSLNAATDLDAGTGVTVSGTYPQNGNLMSVASVADLGRLTVANVSPLADNTADAQDNYELWRFSLQALNQKMSVSHLALTNLGSTTGGDIANFALYDGSTKLGDSVATMDASRMVVFDLKTPLTIESGVTKFISLRGDIKAGSSRTYRFSLQKSSDVTTMDANYNVSVNPNGNVTWSVIQAGGTTTINAGTLTVTKSADSPVNDVVDSASSVLLASWDFKANGEDVKVTSLTFTPAITGNATLLNAQLYYDGVAVGSQTTTVTGGTNFTTTLNNTMVVKADGKTHKLTVKGSTTGTTNPGDTILLTLALGASNAQAVTSLTAVNAPAQATAANTVTLRAGTITPSRVGATAATYVANTNEALLGSWSLVAGSAEDVDVTSFTIKGSNAAGTLNSTSAMNAAFSSGTLWAGGKQIGQAATLASTAAGTTVITLSTPLRVSSSAPVTIELKANIISGATWTATDAIGLSAIASTGITTSSAVAYTAAGTTSTVGPALTITTSGTLSVAIDSSKTISAQFLTPSLMDQELLSFRLTSANEDIKISRLVLNAINGTNNLLSLKLTGTGLATDPSTTVTGNAATFNFSSNAPIVITKDTSKVIVVKASTGALGGLVAGNKGDVFFGSIDATGSSSGSIVQESVGSAFVQGTNFFVAGTNDFALTDADGDLVYFTVAGDGTGTVDNTAGYALATAVGNADLTNAAALTLNGVANNSWTAGDRISKLSAVETIAGNANAGVAYNVGDLVFLYDADDNETGFAVVTTAVASGAAITNLGFSPAGGIAIAAAGDKVVKLTNANGLASSAMQYEETKPVIAYNKGAMPTTGAITSNQVVGAFDITASGLRDMTMSGLTLEKTGNNSPAANVVAFKLWSVSNGNSTKIAEVVNTTVAGSNDDGNTNGVNTDTTVNICTGATTGAVDEIGNITAAEANKLQIGDALTITTTGGADSDVSSVTINSIAGALDACDGNGATGRVLTLSGNVTIDVDDTTVTIANKRVHFDTGTYETTEQALQNAIITQGGKLSLTVTADTNTVRTGLAQGDVSFGVMVPGTAGPHATDVGGLNWTYTRYGSAGTAHTGALGTAAGATADGYPVSADSLKY